MKVRPLLVGCMVLSCAVFGQPAATQRPGQAPTERMALEEKQFVESLAYVYRPELWISYRGALYFAPKEDSQVRRIAELKDARSKYVALTNRETQHELAAAAITESGVGDAWLKKLLLPYSETRPNLTPVLNRAYRVVNGFKVLRVMKEGDALIQDAGGATGLVMNLRAAPAAGTNSTLYLIKEGERAFARSNGEYQQLEAFTSVGLSAEETNVLNLVVAACQRKASALVAELAGSKAREEFEITKARATDSNPYMQYLLARCYLDGNGTPKDERLGLEWMNTAARNGSGDAKTYLEQKGKK